MSKVVFSIYIDIPWEKLDNPGWYDWSSDRFIHTDKSQRVKLALKAFEKQLNEVKQRYAKDIGADYILFSDDQEYADFCEMFRTEYPQISEYDIINFYKHWQMKELSKKYDKVCYLDYDVVPNTKDDIFDAHDPEAFACAESNSQAIRGKRLDMIHQYRHDIRNPATKYWNAHAMLCEEGYDDQADTDVFNTGIMVATKEVIDQFDYFGNFKEVLDLMTFLKNDEDSMYPSQIKRVFNYDNETVFAYKRIVNNVKIDYINEMWHFPLMENGPLNLRAKMFHVISKQFELVLSK